MYPPFRSLPEEVSGLKSLIYYVRGMCNMVEIGCAYGESSEIFSECFVNVFCIDPWEWSLLAEAAFDKVQKRHDNIVKLKGFDTDFVKRVPDGSLDFVYLDGPHTYEEVTLELVQWVPKIKKGGFIGGHDYLEPWGVVQAVNERFGKPDFTFEDSSWLVDLAKR